MTPAEIKAALDRTKKLLSAHRPAEAMTEIRPALAAAQSLDDPKLVFQCATEAGWADEYQEDHAGALAMFTVALAAAERLPPAERDGDVVAYTRLHWAINAADIPGIPAARLLAVVDEVLAKAKTRTLRAEALVQRCFILKQMGQTEAAWETAQRTLELVPHLRPVGRFETLCEAAWFAEAAGHNERALALYEEARRLPWQGMPPLAEAKVLNGLGHALLKAGRAEEAYTCASDLMRAVASMGPQAQHAALGFMVDAARAVGRLDEAFEAAERFLGSARARDTADDTLLRALIDGTNVRIDRGGADAEVDAMLAEAEPIATNLDASSGATFWRDELAKIRARYTP